MNSLTIFTPTFNREKTLLKAYESLCNQTVKNFTWLIIDDGSTDNTKQTVKKFVEEKKLDIKYIQKENGGKHTAWNMALDMIKTELVLVLDSDDTLTQDAVEVVNSKWKMFKHIKDLSGLFFLRKYPTGEPVSDYFKIHGQVTNGLECLLRNNHQGDYCFVFITKVLKRYPFKTFKGEKFIGETSILTKMALENNAVYFNEVIYISDYYEDGLTKQGRAMRINNPLGGMEYANVHLDKRIPSKVRMKSAILYAVYGLFAKKGLINILKESNGPLLVSILSPISICIYIYWKIKFRKNRR